MTHSPTTITIRHRDPLARLFGGSSLLVALLALVFAMSGLGQAKQSQPAHVAAKKAAKKKTAKGARKPLPPVVLKPKAYALLRLNAKKKFPSAAIPTVAAAKNATTVGGKHAKDLTMNCAATTVDLGSWCLDSSTYPVPAQDVDKTDFLYATKACVAAGGYLPTAAQLLGAAARVKLAGTLDDNETNAAIDIDPTDGLKDSREMSATLFTTTSGSSAGGSAGVTGGATGDPRQGEPNPIPAPRDPLPETLNYVTVFDNSNRGGFAGGAPVGASEKFRCAYNKTQGAAATEE